MTPSSNGLNSGSSRTGSGCASVSHTMGTIPKAKGRKKSSGQANSMLGFQQPQLLHQIHPQLSIPQMHHYPPNGQNQSGFNISTTNSNGLSQGIVYNNIPKNQLLFDWQSGESSSSPYRNRRIQHSSSDLYDSASDESVAQDNRHTVPSSLLHRGIFSDVNGSVDTQQALLLHRLRMNGHDTGSGDAPSSLPSALLSHNMALNNGAQPEFSAQNSENNHHWPAADAKKINVPPSPERTQVANRLSQIQDYIKQTTSLMESYNASGVDVSDDSEFLVGVLKDLHDSEAKLKCLLSAFDQIYIEDNVKSNAVGFEGARCLSPSQEQQVNGTNNHSFNSVAGAAKPNDLRKQNEMKMKFKESLRQIHALQVEQALLTQKRSQAQEQLQEAQRARNILLSYSSGRPSGYVVNAQGEVAASANSEDHSQDTLMNSSQDIDGRPSSYRGKYQVTINAEGHQLSPSRELSPKKKKSVDSFQADVTSYLKELMAGDEVKEQASSEDSAVEDAIDEYADARAQVRLQGQIVLDKEAEINALRAQLDQAKGLLNLAHRPLTLDNNPANHATHEQAVNLQRQVNDDSDVSSQAAVKKSNASSKQQLIEQERMKLARLQQLLATVQEYRSSGLPIPDHILSELGCESQSSTSRGASPPQTAGNEEDAAGDADVEEEDEPELTMQWNQKNLSLEESSSMASELSQGLQQRAAQLQIERDGLAAMQRQLDGLFSQLQHQSAEKPTNFASTEVSGSVSSPVPSSSSLLGSRSNSAQQPKRVDEAAKKRIEILSDIHNRCQQLQDNIACDAELNAKAAPVLHATRSALNLLTSQFLPANENAEENTGQCLWDQRSLQGEGASTPSRSEHIPCSLSGDRQSREECQMSSAPSTLMRRKSPADVARNQRAVWSSLPENEPNVSSSLSDSARYQFEENPPIVSMPLPSPNILQQQTREMQNRIPSLSQSCQSLFLDGGEGINTPAAMPLMPVTAVTSIPPPPGSSSHDREAYYQQLLAAGQLQQQQVLLTAVNQCFHMLKLQHHELQNLSNAVHMLSSRPSHVSPMGVHPSVHQGVHHGHGVHSTLDPNVHPGVHPGTHPGAHPGLLQGEEQWATPSTASGPPTLNNQVPPGNRTNNYWDNFRSYSRQNLLSNSAKTNEGLAHSPNPLVERSHNSLRSSTPMPLPGPSSISVSSSVPQFHTVSNFPCIPTVVSSVTQPISVVDSAGAPMGAVGPAPLSTMDFALTSHAQNTSRKDKRNIDHVDGGLGSACRRPSNEIDHRSAARALDDAALFLNPQPQSPTSHDFEVPPMPILRNSVVSFQSRLNQVNFNAPAPFVNLQDFIETQNNRQQLNNEGVPFSEISTSLSNQHFNEFESVCSLDHTRETPRRRNIDHQNGTTEDEVPGSVVLKRNTGAIKRTHPTSQSSSSNAPIFTENYQRNIRSSSTGPHHSSSSSSTNTENSNITQKLSCVFPMSNSDSETVFKSSKQQSAQDSTRNLNSISKRSSFQDEFQIPCSSTSVGGRLRMRHIDETGDQPMSCPSEAGDQEDLSAIRVLGFNNCHSTASSQNSSSQNTSNVELHNLGQEKNQLKESCFQIQKGSKYHAKTSSRSPHTDSTSAPTASGASVSHNTPSLLNFHRSAASKVQASNRHWSGNKNNQGCSVLKQLSGQGQLLEELRESVYSEMTSLISANETRPQFLIQLLRDLQQISSDSVRQSVLQLIQQAFSRYQIDFGALGQGCGLGAGAQENGEDEDEGQAKSIELQKLEKERLVFSSACSSSDMKASLSSTQEGETLMQLVLGLELASVFSMNSEETCSPSLIEDVRNRILQLLPLPPSESASNAQPSNSTRSVYFLHSQIDSILESVFSKFHGRRIGDVRSEITSCLVNMLPVKLMYRSMVDYYSRNNMEAEADLRKENTASPSVNPVCLSPHQFSHHASHLNQYERDVSLAEASNGDLAEADQSHHSLDPVNNDLEAIDGDGDSEADRECAAEGCEPPPTLLNLHLYQLSGSNEVNASELEVGASQDEREVLASAAVADRLCFKNDVAGAVGPASSSGEENDPADLSTHFLELTLNQKSKLEVGESWTSEQDRCRETDQEKDREREQGLDQVPTRLASDSDRDQENGEKHRSHHLAMPPNDPPC